MHKRGVFGAILQTQPAFARAVSTQTAVNSTSATDLWAAWSKWYRPKAPFGFDLLFLHKLAGKRVVVGRSAKGKPKEIGGFCAICLRFL